MDSCERCQHFLTGKVDGVQQAYWRGNLFPCTDFDCPHRDTAVTQATDAQALLDDADGVRQRTDDAQAEDIIRQLVDALKKREEQLAAIEEDGTEEHNAAVRLRSELARERRKSGMRSMATAPRDGTLVILLVEGEQANFRTEDDDRWRTIGSNNFDNDGDDAWLFSGWCWSHDHWVQGEGTPIGWWPLPIQQETARDD